jgi:hypothetical protein
MTVLFSSLSDNLHLIGHPFAFGADISKRCLEDFEVLNYNQEAWWG